MLRRCFNDPLQLSFQSRYELVRANVAVVLSRLLFGKFPLGRFGREFFDPGCNVAICDRFKVNATIRGRKHLPERRRNGTIEGSRFNYGIHDLIVLRTSDFDQKILTQLHFARSRSDQSLAL